MSITRSWRAVATVNQLRTAVKLEPRPQPDPRPAAASARSLRPPTSRAAATGSHFPTRTPRSSTPPWRLIVMR